jgi:uncharacterized protein (TIGR00645 family)
LAATAEMAAFLSTVFLFRVPRCRPPHLSILVASLFSLILLYFGGAREHASPQDKTAHRSGVANIMYPITRFVELAIFSSRWIVVPFLLGLVAGLVVLLAKFIVRLADFLGQVRDAEPSDVIVGILNLVDFTLTANLTVIVICSTYENFVRRIDYAKHPRIGFSGLKQKLLGSILAIAAVNVLESFIDINHHTDSVKLAWVVGFLLAFAVLILVLAIADGIGTPGEGKEHQCGSHFDAPQPERAYPRVI